VLRGNHREAIFHGSADFLAFEEILAAALERHGARLHAYCWMTNHVHLAIQVDSAPLGRVMQLVAARYARRKQRRVPTTGHLFERRYLARLVDADRYLLALVRYIHLNPVRAGIVRTAERYRWSSHRAYLGQSHPPWLTLDLAMGLLGRTAYQGLEGYLRLMRGALDEDEVSAVRVQWTSPRRTDGNDVPRSARPVRPRPVRPQSLEAILAEVAAERGTPVELMTSRDRSPALVQSRAEVARRALREDVATLSEVAARLGRSPSTLSELLRCR
jgi:REP element-mobilizing transposase RayT